MRLAHLLAIVVNSAAFLAGRPSTAETLSFQDGVSPSSEYAGTRDTTLKQAAPGTSFGSSVLLRANGAPDETILLRWDVRAIPAGSTVTAASITFDIRNGAPQIYEVYAGKRAWPEAEATWNVFGPSHPWQQPGAAGSLDRGATSLARIGGTTLGLRTYPLNATGVALVQSWVNQPSGNRGLVVQDFAAADELVLSARESADPNRRPKLNVSFTPPGSVTRLCFFGDTATGANAAAVLSLCQSANVDAMVHLGDLDYLDSPSTWEAFLNAQVGPNYPYFYVLGNHDMAQASGYVANAEARFNRLGLSWTGSLATHCTFDWRGLRFIMTTPGIGDASAAPYIRDQAAASSVPWVLSLFHKQQRLMQVGGKLDATGWAVFEEARLQGVTTWNGHEHSYGRTHLLSNMTNQVVADNTSPYTVARGTSMVVQTGLGGNSVRVQFPQALLPYWASVYTADQGATYGANICTFGAAGDPRRADCVFRNIDGVDVDAWTMFSAR